MSLTQKLIICFWIFVFVMGLWEFHNYNRGLDAEAEAKGPPQHYLFLPPSTKPTPVSMKHEDGADIVQTRFWVEYDKPTPGSFLCHVMIKNVGNARATGIQVKVRPFRGVSNYNEDGGTQHPITLDDSDPTSMISDFLSFPDLDPGQSETGDVSFLDVPIFKPGKNPSPTIYFQTVKSAAKPGAAGH